MTGIGRRCDMRRDASLMAGTRKSANPLWPGVRPPLDERSQRTSQGRLFIVDPPHHTAVSMAAKDHSRVTEKESMDLPEASYHTALIRKSR